MKTNRLPYLTAVYGLLGSLLYLQSGGRLGQCASVCLQNFQASSPGIGERILLAVFSPAIATSVLLEEIYGSLSTRLPEIAAPVLYALWILSNALFWYLAVDWLIKKSKRNVKKNK
jgi:hypothetical protein